MPGDHEEIRKPKKEMQDLAKALKVVVKNSERLRNICFKQLERCEAKFDKRSAMVAKIQEIEAEVNSELRKADEYAKKRKLFATKYVYGSKLGASCPEHNVAVVAEVTDKMSEWTDEAREDVIKFFHVVDKTAETFNLFLLGNTVQSYKPQYQQTQSKTGVSDCLKWFQKNFNSKAACSSPWPPDWQGLTSAVSGAECPSAIYLVCSRAPKNITQAISELNEVRHTEKVPIPVFAVAYDPEVEKDDYQQVLFEEFIGGEGSYLVDTTKVDMEFVEKVLASVKTKKKLLEKLQKQLDKVEDCSALLEQHRKTLQGQIAIENCLRNDLELVDLGLRRPA